MQGEACGWLPFWCCYFHLYAHVVLNLRNCSVALAEVSPPSHFPFDYPVNQSQMLSTLISAAKSG